MWKRLPWQEELAIVDRTMKAISGVTDPEELVDVYWQGIGELLPVPAYVATSRRNVEPPFYLISRSSRFTEHPNPWTQRDPVGGRRRPRTLRYRPPRPGPPHLRRQPPPEDCLARVRAALADFCVTAPPTDDQTPDRHPLRLTRTTIANHPLQTR